jgi:hypothetical protein
VPQLEKVEEVEECTQKLICPYEHRECDHPLYLDSGAVTCHPECIRQYSEPMPIGGSWQTE